MIKKIPMRRCVGCMEQKSKRELIRAKAQKARRLERAFSCEIPAEVYERIGKELESHE